MGVYTGIRKSLLISVLSAVLAGCTPLPEEEQAFSEFISSEPVHELSGSVSEETADSELASDADLSRILAFAAVHNPGLRASFHSWQAAREKVSYSGSLPDPQFSFMYFLREIETKVGPQQGKVSFSQMIPSPGKLSAMEQMVLKQAEVKYREFQTAKLTLFRKIRTAYYKYAYLSEAEILVRENIDRLNLLGGVIDTAYRGGKAPYSNYIRIQIGIEKEKERLASLKDSKENMILTLNAMLNRGGQSGFPAPRIALTPVFTGEALEPEELLSLLKRYNPELTVIDKQIEAAEQGLSLASSSDSSNFMVGADWAITGRSEMNVEDNGKDPVMVMFGLSVPLNRAKYRAMEDEAREKLRAVRKMKHNRENLLLAEARVTLNDLSSARRRIALFRDNLLEKAQQSYDVSRKAFQSGETDFLDMLDNIKLIIEMQLTLAMEKSQQLQKEADLLFMFGEEHSIFEEKKP